MDETGWMYESLTERFGETLGDRQKVVDALLIAKAVVGPGTLGGTNSDSLLTVARFILDEWGKYSGAEDAGDGPRRGAPEFLFYSDLYRIRTGELDVSPDDVWVTSTGDRVRIRGGKLFILGTDIFEGRVEYPPFVPSEKSFPLTKEN